MRSRPCFITIVVIGCVLSLPALLVGQGGQISPNPNSAGNTITLGSPTEFYFWYNSQNFLNEGIISSYNTFENYDSLNNASGGVIDNRYILSNDGTFWNREGAVVTNHDLGDNVGGRLQNTGFFFNSGELNNNLNGLVYNFVGATFTNNGMFTNYGFLRNDGTFYNATTMYNYGTLSGTGSWVGNFQDQGILKPGNSAGVFTVDGSLIKSGTVGIELGGVFDGGGDNFLTEYDWLDISGDLELSGFLNVSFINDFALVDLYTFDIIRVGGSLTGQFDGLDEGAVVGNFGGVDLYITYKGGDGNDISLYNSSSVPEPGATGMLLLGCFAMVAIRRKRRIVQMPARLSSVTGGDP